MAARRKAGLMTIAHLLDEFECQIPESSPASGRKGAAEDAASLDLYEQGYQHCFLRLRRRAWRFCKRYLWF